MEQKQIDEIDESFFGDEFVDDDDQLKTDSKKDTKLSKTDDDKKVSTKKKVVKKETVKANVTSESVKNKDDLDEVKVSLIKDEPSKDKEEKVTVSTKVDPWEDDEDTGMFKEASTWKALTGIAVILLLLSVFTQGFSFDSDNTRAQITLSEAEDQALSFVNTHLLQPPFTATMTSSEDSGALYKLTLEVAGEQIDSYITKDGELFFPQGFDMKEMQELDAAAQLQEPDIESDVVVKEDAKNDIADTNEEVAAKPTQAEAKEVETAPNPVEQAPTGSVVELDMVAKRWLFSPREVVVSKGDTVKLKIVPEGLDFTFSVVDFGVEEQVVGSTMVEFTATNSGTYEFTCSSCESWRGMKGTLVVE